MTDGPVDMDDVSFIISSRYRVLVVRTLAESGPSTPSMIAEEHDVDIAHTSRSLQELRERDVVRLLVDEDVKKGRLYDLHEDAEATAAKMAEIAAGGRA